MGKPVGDERGQYDESFEKGKFYSSVQDVKIDKFKFEISSLFLQFQVQKITPKHPLQSCFKIFKNE